MSKASKNEAKANAMATTAVAAVIGAEPGKPVNPDAPVLQRKGKAKATSTKSASDKKPADGVKAKGKAVKALPEVTASKPEKALGKRASAMANSSYTVGFDLTKWPSGADEPKPPGLIELHAMQALNVCRGATKDFLAGAYYLTESASKYDVEAVGRAIAAVCGGIAGRKCNVVNIDLCGGAKPLCNRFTEAVAQGEGQRARIGYRVTPTERGRKLISEYFQLNKLKVPKRWLVS